MRKEDVYWHTHKYFEDVNDENELQFNISFLQILLWHDELVSFHSQMGSKIQKRFRICQRMYAYVRMEVVG